MKNFAHRKLNEVESKRNRNDEELWFSFAVCWSNEPRLLQLKSNLAFTLHSVTKLLNKFDDRHIRDLYYQKNYNDFIILKNCIFRPAVLTGTLSWFFLVFTNFDAFIQYLAECKVTNTGTSQHCRQSPNLFQKFQQACYIYKCTPSSN